ncbi:MAG: S9 family peptidase [Bacteroidales bacterium]|nr:S9 family peptidase [Bacteroidales bacterium]
MKRVFLAVLTAICLTSVWAQQYTLADLTSGEFNPKGISEMVSSEDGMHYYQADPGKTAVIKFSYATGEAVDTLFNVRDARGATFNTFQGFLVSPDENRVLVYLDREQVYRRSFRATYYYHDVRRNLVRKLSEQTSKQMIPTFSPDGKMVAYVIDNNIWLTKFDFDTESQVTRDGEQNKVINGATDWVYEEEFGVTRLMEFSPDNQLLAFVRTDESEVKEFSFQTFNEQLYPDYYRFKYPKAGEANSKVECRVFDVAARTTKTLDVPLDEDGYIPRIKFTKDAEQLAVMTLNRDQNRFDMYFVNPRSTVSRLALREESNHFIDSKWLHSIYFTKERFTYVSERDGYSHIYLYGISGTLQRPLTSGNYDVTSLLAVDEQRGLVYYEAAGESPLRREIYRVNMEKGVPEKLSQQQGYNSAAFSEQGKFYVNRWSDANTPTVITLHDGNGKQLRALEANQPLRNKVATAGFPEREYITVTAADGITPLNGWVLKPAGFNPARKYPVVMVQYSGPNSQQVLDRYSRDWYYALLNEGMVVACVDGRGTGARGAQFRNSTYRNLGIHESDDQIAAARHLASLPYIDENSIGIWGWSYGGYNVLMSMSRGNGIFSAGVAIAPVTDWRFYDTIYTERFMRTPQQNNPGYENGSPMALANQLEGNLLIVHGTADDNVHVQNSVEYARALIKAGKHFDMFFFPDEDHSIRGDSNRKYLYEKVINYFKNNM